MQRLELTPGKFWYCHVPKPFSVLFARMYGAREPQILVHGVAPTDKQLETVRKSKGQIVDLSESQDKARDLRAIFARASAEEQEQVERRALQTGRP